MPKFVRVRVKKTGALIWVGQNEVNDTVGVLDRQPAQPVGGYAPTPHQNLSPALPSEEPADQVAGADETPEPSAPSGSRRAGKSGTKKEGSS